MTHSYKFRKELSSFRSVMYHYIRNEIAVEACVNFVSEFKIFQTQTYFIDPRLGHCSVTAAVRIKIEIENMGSLFFNKVKL